ncbi:hypothetical protein SFHH103_04180 (plasmid) [Sinorhizobium fredii HH103]|uniref:Toprim domain-containing protein n=10 Tax=Sinorhizobium/Ensifer group TaxID=227292 RepID=G9AC90_SINF1|nr:hypothetical protein SFHH103_04180 [Sinorhizobium fredii HH103]
MLNPSQTSRLLHGFRFEAPWESLRVGNGARWYNGGGWSPSTEGALRQLASRPDALLLAATDANPQGELFAERLRALAVETGCDWSRLRPPEEDWNETLKIREKEKRERKEDGVPHSHRPRQGKLRPAEPALDPAGRDAGGPEGVMKD